VRLPQRQRKVANAVLVYMLVLLSLQIFLASVAAEGLLDGDASLAWAATAISAVLALIAGLFYRFLR
jgi:hypothetical protein